MSGSSDIVVFDDRPPPPGASPWVAPHGAAPEVHVVPPDPRWPELYRGLAARISAVLGEQILALEHVGSTAVPGLHAKPIIDVDLAVADSADEQTYVPALVELGLVLVVREPWWYEHRMLRGAVPRCNLHVHTMGSPELARHRIFRDWLRDHPDDRTVYEDAKLAAAEHTRIAGGHQMDYNARKEATVREIYGRAFAALGLT